MTTQQMPLGEAEIRLTLKGLDTFRELLEECEEPHDISCRLELLRPPDYIVTADRALPIIKEGRSITVSLQASFTYEVKR